MCIHHSKIQWLKRTILIYFYLSQCLWVGNLQVAQPGCSGPESFRRQWSDVSWGCSKAHVGLEDLLPWLTYVAGKLVRGLHSSCGHLHELLECSQDIAAGSPQGGQFKRERARRELYPFWGSALEIAQYLFCPILLIKNELPRVVLIQGEGITLYLFKGEVSKNSWTYLKVPYLVECGPQLNPTLLSGKFYQTLCKCVQILFIG